MIRDGGGGGRLELGGGKSQPPPPLPLNETWPDSCKHFQWGRLEVWLGHDWETETSDTSNEKNSPNWKWKIIYI